ncbi:MAG: hypothetical protein KAX49_14045 [Halanaerobiales bacterium]|nr:hypothetical protein [Halanaerobiales bacterium]
MNGTIRLNEKFEEVVDWRETFYVMYSNGDIEITHRAESQYPIINIKEIKKLVEVFEKVEIKK